MDRFHTVNLHQTFTEGAEVPFEGAEIEPVPPTDYGAFVLEALTLMKRGGPTREPLPGSDREPFSLRSDPPQPSSSSSTLESLLPASPTRKRKRGEDPPPRPEASSSSQPAGPSSASGSSSPPSGSSSSSLASTSKSSASTSRTSFAPSSSAAESSGSSYSPAASSTPTFGAPPPAPTPSGGSIDQAILRQSLLLASSFLLTDATMNPEAGLKTWSAGLSTLIEIILALHRKDALEVETMRVAALALRECWTAGGNFPGLEYSRERIRQSGLKLKNLCEDPTRYKGHVIT